MDKPSIANFPAAKTLLLLLGKERTFSTTNDY